MNKQDKKVPTLRFKGFTNDWEQLKLGEIGIIKSGIGFPTSQQGGAEGTPFYKVSDMNKPGNELVMKSSSNYVSNRQINDNHWKPIEKTPAVIFAKVGAALMLNRKRLVNQSFLIDNNTMSYSFSNSWDTIFGYTLFLTLNLPKYAQTGALPSFNAKDIQNIKVSLPLKNEQHAIGELMAKVSNIVTLQQRKLDLLKQLKKGLLQKMFADKGSKRPILRFEGFSNDWEQRKLKDIKDVRDGTHSSPKYQEEGYPLITSKNLATNGIDLSDVSFISKHDYQEINKRSKVENGDILFGMIGTIGNPVIVKKDGFAIKNVALIKYGGELLNYFLLYLLKSPIFLQYINRENAGGTQKFLALSVIRNFKFRVPSKAEQENIAHVLNSLTRLITLQQRKITKYNEIKKSLLQQMFI